MNSSKQRHSATREPRPQSCMVGIVKEHINSQCGILEVREISGRPLQLPLTIFFHSSSVWLTDDSNNSMVKFTGPNLQDYLPYGSKVNLTVKNVSSSYFTFGADAVWPLQFSQPPGFPPDAEPQLHRFVSWFEKSSPNLVQATFPRFPLSASLLGRATIYCINDDDYGLIALSGKSQGTEFKFFCIFHKAQIWLPNHQHIINVEEELQKPLQSLVKIGQEVSLSARSIITSSGVDLVPSVLELQAIVVSLDPNVIPDTAPKPTMLQQGNGSFGLERIPTWYFLQSELHNNLNVILTTYLIKFKNFYPNINPNCVTVDPAILQSNSISDPLMDLAPIPLNLPKLDQSYNPNHEPSRSSAESPRNSNLVPLLKNPTKFSDRVASLLDDVFDESDFPDFPTRHFQINRPKEKTPLGTSLSESSRKRSHYPEEDSTLFTKHPRTSFHPSTSSELHPQSLGQFGGQVRLPESLSSFLYSVATGGINNLPGGSTQLPTPVKPKDQVEAQNNSSPKSSANGGNQKTKSKFSWKRY